MSDKARGKQRTVDLQEEGSSDSSAFYEMSIRFSDGSPDLRVQLQDTSCIREVKAIIRENRPTLNTKRLRLIHSGRILVNQARIYGRGGVFDGQTGASGKQSHWLHCAIGSTLETPEGEEDEESAQVLSFFRL
jgi:hypothetical protein